MKTLTYKLPLYPTKEQQELLWEWSRALNDLYNHFIELQKDRLEKNQPLLGRYDMQNLIPTLKNEMENLNKVYADARQQCAFRVDDAITKWRRKQSSFPHFRSGYQFFNIIYGCFEKSCKLKDGYFIGGKLPPIKVNIYRELKGHIKTASVHCDSAGRWWLILESKSFESEKTIHLDKIIGIDLGCKNLISTSDGYTIQPPKFLKRMDDAIRDLQSRIDTYHKPTGSKKNGTYHMSRTCRRLKKTIRRLYGKRARMMRNFLHTRSRKIVNHYDIVVVENLRVKEMKENGKKSHTPASKTVNRIMSQNAVSMFTNMLSYKSKQYLEVNPAYTSKTCAACGHVRDTITLDDRTYKCCTCGSELDRDVNAAVNIRNLGLLQMLHLIDDRSDIRAVAYHIPHCNITYPCKAFV